MKQRELVVAMGIVLFILAAYWFSVECRNAVIDPTCPTAQALLPAVNLLPVVAGLGVLLGALLYYFMDKQNEETKMKGRDVAEVVLRFLNPVEKKIVSHILNHNGLCLQADISRIEGVGKLRAHRAIQRLSDVGVITTNGLGKTNTIQLDPKLLEYLKKD